MKHTNIHKYNRAKNRGITLIALVITIIVLIILAGISISILLSEEGLFDKAKSAQKIQDVASLKEALELEKAPIQVDNAGNVDLDDYLEQIQKSKKNYTLDSIERLDDNNAEIVVNDKYKFLVKDKQNGDVEIIYEGIASIGDLEISETSGTYTYPIPGEIQVTKNASGGELSVKSKNENIAKAEINGTTVTVTPGTKAGTIGIVVTSAANGEYAENRVTHTATVLNGEIKITAEPYIGNYDGKEHNALSVTTDPEDVNLSYSLNGKESSDIPKVTGADNYSVTVTASKEGYMTTTETITVTVGKNNEAGNLTLSEYSGTLTYPETKTFTVNKNVSEGQLSVQSSNDNVVKAEIDGSTVTLKPQAISTNGQTATITVTSAATANYEAQTAEYEVTVNQGSIKIEATPYNSEFDGAEHEAISKVTTTPTECTVKYALKGETYGTEIPKVATAGSYTVSIQASKEGYATETINANVTISEFTGKNITIGEAINVKDYGKQVVEYTKTTSELPSGIWRLFYQDANFTYIIADDLGKSYNLATEYAKGDYEDGSKVSIIGQKLNPQLLAKGTFFKNTNKNTSIMGIAWLTDPKQWKDYTEKNALYAIGSPTLELFAKSFNATKKVTNTDATEITISVTDYGYSAIVNVKLKSTYNNGIYSKGHNYFHWLASPAGTLPDYVLHVYSYNPDYSDIRDRIVSYQHPVRPIVCFYTKVFNENYTLQ